MYKVNYNDRDGTAHEIQGETVSELIEAIPDNIQKDYARKHLLTDAGSPVSLTNLMSDAFAWNVTEMQLGQVEAEEEDCCNMSCGCHTAA